MSAAAIADRLVLGHSLEDLGLESSDGRLVITGLGRKPSKTLAEFEAAGMAVSISDGNTIVEDVAWTNLKFVNCDFSRFKLFNCKLNNCIFVKCNCQGMGFWTSALADVHFIRCDLRSSVPGGLDVLGVQLASTFRSVSFLNCDLRKSTHTCEIYEHCSFIHCKLDSVNFNAAVFERCRFEGPLKEVEFRFDSPISPDQRKNYFLNCDFSKASFGIYCGFDRIPFDTAILPDDPDIIFLPNGPSDLMKWNLTNDQPDSFATYLIENAGTPSIVSRGLLLTVYTSAQVDSLIKIAHH